MCTWWWPDSVHRNLKEHVEDAFEKGWANVARDSRDKLIQDLNAYMTGGSTSTGTFYKEIVADGSFVELDTMTRVDLEQITKQLFIATAINEF
jgi:hypothetical protein